MSSPEQPNQPELPDPSAPAARMPAQPAHHAAEPVETIVDERTVIVRRAPRYFNFMLLGAIVGAFAAFILTVSFPENADFGRLQVFGFLLLAFLALGVGLGCLVALIVDRFVGRGGTTAVADRLDGHVPGVAPAVASTANTPSAGPANDGAAPDAPDSHDFGTNPE
ncbi:hypothetical protein [Glaciibacter sp. 2TAF33]|uniref:hypothetical protein n=1 Tax=Glaciibacter sp. 2TAF33 TaxID=3233015 RepID=UPI003F8F77C1